MGKEKTWDDEIDEIMRQLEEGPRETTSKNYLFQSVRHLRACSEVEKQVGGLRDDSGA